MQVNTRTGQVSIGDRHEAETPSVTKPEPAHEHTPSAEPDH